MLRFTEHKIEYILTYFLIGITGINFFSGGDGFLVIGLIISYYYFLKKGLKYDKYLMGYLLFFAALQIVQFAILGGIEILTFLKILFRILLAYHILKITDINFHKYYVNIIYFFSIISFIFYFPTLFFPAIESFFQSFVIPFTQPLFYLDAGFKDIIIYNFGAQEWGRNSGPFWEPGAFVGFLSLAIIFDYINDRRIFSKKKIIFYLAILTTLSTTGYIVLFIILTFFLYLNAYKLYAIIFFILLIPFSFYAYNSLPFLKEKISDSYYYSQNYSIYAEIAVNRFSSVYLDFQDLKKSPIVGISDNRNLRYGRLNEEKDFKTWTHRNNGVSYFLSAFGVFGFLVYFGLMFYSFKRLAVYYDLKPKFGFFFFLIILIVGLSEKYFTRELFFGLSILFLLYKKEPKSNFSQVKK